MAIPLSIALLLRIILLLLFFLIINLLYLAYKKRDDVKGRRIKEAYIQEKQLIWFDYFREGTGIPTILIPKNRYEIEGIEQIFLVYLHNLKTSSIVEKISQFSNEYLYTHYKGELNSRRWSRRMNAMERIVDFQIDRLVDDCHQMNQEKLSTEEQFQQLKIIANLKEEEFICALRKTTHIFSEYAYKRIFMDVSEDVFEALLKEIDTLPLTCQYCVVDLVGIRRERAYLSYLNTFISSNDDEMRIRALKAIYEIGVVTDIQSYTQFSEADAWEERLMFVKLLAYIPVEEAYPHLRKRMRDEAWWVRLQAGTVMRNYKNGAQLLEEIVETEQDPFAVDMAKAFLKEGDNR